MPCARPHMLTLIRIRGGNNNSTIRGIRMRQHLYERLWLCILKYGPNSRPGQHGTEMHDTEPRTHAAHKLRPTPPAFAERKNKNSSSGRALLNRSTRDCLSLEAVPPSSRRKPHPFAPATAPSTSKADVKFEETTTYIFIRWRSCCCGSGQSRRSR